MKNVNPYFLHELLAPLTGLADDDSAVETYRGLDSNDSSKVRQIIRRVLLPHFSQLRPPGKERAKLALSYYLSKPAADFARVFDSCLLPFAPPDDVRLFFVWLWEELFPSESYEQPNLTAFREVPDPYEPTRF